ncbi:hypothetical protein Tco_0448042 [Tanacetum coccineum]
MGITMVIDDISTLSNRSIGKRTGRDPKGNIMILPPVSVEEHIVVQRETKARTILLQLYAKDRMLYFHHLDGWREYLASAITLKIKGGLDYLSFDDLYNKLRTLEIDVNGGSSYDSIDLEELDSKWHYGNALSLGINRFEKKAGRKMKFNIQDAAWFVHEEGHICYKCSGVRSLCYGECYRKTVWILKQDHEGEDVENGAAQVYGMIAGAEEDAAGSATGNATGDVADDVSNVAAEFSLMGIASQELAEETLYDRFVKAVGMHVVPPPITGTFMPPSNNPDLDDTQVTYGSKSNNYFETNSVSNDFVSCDTVTSLRLTDHWLLHHVCFMCQVLKLQDQEPLSLAPSLVLLSYTMSETAVQQPSFPNDDSSFSFKENVKPPRNVCNKGGINSLAIYNQMYMDEGRWGTAVKPSAGCSWRIQRPNMQWGSKNNGGSSQSTWFLFLNVPQSRLQVKQLIKVLLHGGTDDFSGLLGFLCWGLKLKLMGIRRDSRTLIEATRTMLADSKLPTMFWTEADSTAGYVLNRVLVTKPYNKTPYELVREKLMKVLLLDKPNVQGLGHEWYFDLDYLTDSLGYNRFKTNQPAGTQDTNIHAGTQDDSDSECSEEVIVVPSFPSNSFSGPKVLEASKMVESSSDYAEELARLQKQAYEANATAEKHLSQADLAASRNRVPAGKIDSAAGVSYGPTETSTPVVKPVHTDAPSLPPGHSLGSSEHSSRYPSPSDLANTMSSSSEMEDIHHHPDTGIFSSSSYDDDFGGTVTNLAPSVVVDSVPTKRVNTIHPQSQILGDLTSPVQTRGTLKKSKFGASAFVSYVHDQQRNNHTDYLHCLFACFLSQLEPSSVAQALNDPAWVEAMQEEMQQFINQKVWQLVPLPDGKIAIGTKWILKNKRDARAFPVMGKLKKKFMLLTYRDLQILISLGIVYRVVKALYGLHQHQEVGGAPPGLLWMTLIFGSTNKAWCDEFEVLMKGEFEMSAMGELTFFLGLQVKQEPDGIFISQIHDRFPHVFERTRPDIQFAVSACSRHQVTPLTSNLNAVKKIFKYLKGQPKLGLWYPRDSPFVFGRAYSECFAGSHVDRNSTTGRCQFLGRRFVSCSANANHWVRPSTDAEYVAAANCCGSGMDNSDTPVKQADLLQKQFSPQWGRPTTTPAGAPVTGQGHSSDPNIASSSRPHVSTPDLFTSTNVEDDIMEGSFPSSPPRSTKAPPEERDILRNLVFSHTSAVQERPPPWVSSASWLEAVPTGGSHEADIPPSPSVPTDDFAGDVPAAATTGSSADTSNKGKSPLLEDDPPVRERTFRQRKGTTG